MLDRHIRSIINSDLSGHNSPRGPVPRGGRVEGNRWFRNSPSNLDTPSWGGWSEPLESLEESHACYRRLAPSLRTPHQRSFWILDFPLFCFDLHLFMPDIFALKITLLSPQTTTHTPLFSVARDRRKLIWKNKCQSSWCLCENRSLVSFLGLEEVLPLLITVSKEVRESPSLSATSSGILLPIPASLTRNMTTCSSVFILSVQSSVRSVKAHEFNLLTIEYRFMCSGSAYLQIIYKSTIYKSETNL